MNKKIYFILLVFLIGLFSAINLNTDLLRGFLSPDQQIGFIEEHVNQKAFEAEFIECPENITNSASNIKKQKEVVENLLANNTDEVNRNMFFDIVRYYNTQTVDVNVIVEVEGEDTTETEIQTQRLLNKDLELDTLEQGASFVVYEDIQKIGLLANQALGVSCSNQEIQDTIYDTNREDTYFTVNFQDEQPITNKTDIFIHNLDSLANTTPTEEGSSEQDTEELSLEKSEIGEKFNLFQTSLSSLLLQTNQKRYRYQTILFETQASNITTNNISELNKELREDFNSIQAGSELLDNKFTGVHKTQRRTVSGFQKHELDITSIQNVNLNYKKDYILAIKLESTVSDRESNFPEDSDLNSLNREKYILIHIKDRLQKLESALRAKNSTTDTIKASSDGTLLITVDIPAGNRENLPEEIEDNLELIRLELSNARDEIISIPAKAVTSNSIIFEANQSTNNLKNGSYKATLIVFENQEIELQQTFVLEDIISTESGVDGGGDIFVDTNLITLLSPNNVSINITGTNLSNNPERYILTQRNLIKERAVRATVNELKTEAVLEFQDIDVCYNADCSNLKLALLTEDLKFDLETNVVVEIEKRALSVSGTNTNLLKVELGCLDKYQEYRLVIKSDTTQTKDIIEVCRDTENGPVLSLETPNNLESGVYNFSIETVGTQFNQHQTVRKVIAEEKQLTPEKISEKSFLCTNGNKSLPGTKTTCKTIIGPDQILDADIVVFIEGENFETARRLVKKTTNSGTFLEATGIPVPNTPGEQPNIFLANRNNSEEIFQTKSFIEIINVADRDLDGFTSTDKLNVEITEEFSIGDNINMNIEIPNSLEFGFLQVAYIGDRDTRNNKGALYTYCSKEFVDNVDKQFIKKACNKFTKNSNIVGPDIIMLEDYNTNKIQVPGTYDIRITGLTLNPDNTLTKFVERQKDAFVANAKIYLINSGMSVNYPYNQTVNTGNVFQRFFSNEDRKQIAPNPKCMSLYSDINMNNPLCNDLVYLNDLGVYKGQFDNDSKVANTHKQALRAHLYTMVERVYNKTQNLPSINPDIQQMLSEINDIDEEMARNQNNHWWLIPTFTLKHYNLINTNADGNLLPFTPVTQYQAAAVIAKAAGVLPSNINLRNPQEIVNFYQEIDIKINPQENATIGDLVALVARTIKIQKNPYLYQQSKTDRNRIYTQQQPQYNYQPNPYQNINPSYQNQYYQNSVSPYYNYYPGYGYM